MDVAADSSTVNNSRRAALWMIDQARLSLSLFLSLCVSAFLSLPLSLSFSRVPSLSRFLSSAAPLSLCLSGTTQGPSWGYLKVFFSETLSMFGDKRPQNGSKNEEMAPRTKTGYPHIGPFVGTVARSVSLLLSPSLSPSLSLSLSLVMSLYLSLALSIPISLCLSVFVSPPSPFSSLYHPPL